MCGSACPLHLELIAACIVRSPSGSQPDTPVLKMDPSFLSWRPSFYRNAHPRRALPFEQFWSQYLKLSPAFFIHWISGIPFLWIFPFPSCARCWGEERLCMYLNSLGLSARAGCRRWSGAPVLGIVTY
ncbi:hypothetical protein RRG08_007194 [Elysia crispata]|uniref:Uncharacterized protein n=1 Tax=Elysia crispata TaxID=231223 RepID=A0AAE1B583_9GAST|nr:hypothetical protein RRG08_007194 [Elysia crispata]